MYYLALSLYLWVKYSYLIHYGYYGIYYSNFIYKTFFKKNSIPDEWVIVNLS